jgi:hypothetical protein
LVPHHGDELLRLELEVGERARILPAGSVSVMPGRRRLATVRRGGRRVEDGQPDGAKANFTAIRVSRRRGYSPYTRYIIGIG